MKNILVTGGAGFIGANFVHYMLEKYPDYKIINLDLLTYAGNIHNLDDLKDNPNHIFVHGNITNRELVEYLVDTYTIDTIINFAAESHVDRSIVNPGIFIDSNIQGTLNLLDIAKRKNLEKYLQISTDEVYGTLGDEGYFTEETPLAPNSPYSASKTSADLLVRSYYETYGMNVNITRCSNNYGPYQFPEKLIPLMIQHGLDGLSLPVYGDGKNIRDWLHVYDHCQAIDLVLHKGKSGEVYNIGGHNERTNNQIVEIIAKRLNCEDRIEYVKDRLGNDKRYAMDPTKIESELGWKPKYTFDTGIVETIDWYLANENWWRPLIEKAKFNRFDYQG
ncbi:dTDP-glucose 4,6-dehydratase [Ligilactobacillus sp. LYQ135]